MGLISKNFSCSSYDQQPNSTQNPNPRYFKILKHIVIGDFLIIKINYPNCINYEGNKILVYSGISINDLQKQGSIDPHFSNNINYYSPIARFQPTDRGWKLATCLANTIVTFEY